MLDDEITVPRQFTRGKLRSNVMTDQLNGAWGVRLLYGEPVGPIPSELSHGPGSVASHVYIDGYVSKDFCGT